MAQTKATRAKIPRAPKRAAESLGQRYERLQLALAGANEGVWDWDLETNHVYFSPEWSAMLGYAPNEIQADFQEWEKRVHPDDMPHVQKSLSDHIQGLAPYYMSEHRLRHKSGQWCWVLDRGAIVERDANGKPVRMCGTHTEITFLKSDQLQLRAERAELEQRIQSRTAELDSAYQSLRETERRQTALLNNIPDIAWLKDGESRFIAVNQPFAQTAGTTPEALVGKTDYDIWPPTLAEQYRADDALVIESRQLRRVEEPIADVTGKWVWIETVKMPVLNEQGNVIGTVGIARDISERKQLDEMRNQTQTYLERLVRERTEALEQKNRELQNQIIERQAIEQELASQRDFAVQVMNTMGQGLVVTDADGKFEFVNAAYAEMLGYAPSDLTGKCPEELALVTAPLILPSSAGVRQRGEAISYEQKFRHRDGTPVEVLVTGVPRYLGKQATGTIAVITDLTERKQMEHDLRTGQERYRGMIESQQALIVRVNPDGHFTYVNDVYCRTFGKTRQELLGSNFAPLVHPDDLAQTLEAMQGLSAPPYRIYVEQRAMTLNGWRWFAWEDYAIRDENGTLVEIQGVASDITERKQAEESLILQRDLGLRLGSATDLRKALSTVLDAACHIQGIDSGGVYLFDRNEQTLLLVAHQNLSEEFIARATTYHTDTPQVQLVLKGEPVYINYRAPGYAETFAHRHEKLQAVAVLPILHEGIPVAAINLGSHTDEELAPTTRAVLETIVSHVGSVLARLHAESALRESQRNLQSLFDTLDDFLFILDDHGNILQVNPVVLNRLGYAFKELRGQSVLMLHPQDRRTEAREIIAAMLEGKAEACPIPLARRDGQTIPVETKVTRGFWGEHPVLFGISRDIFARQRAETAIRRHAAILEAVNVAAERFLGTADWSANMNRVLERLGQAAEVDRVYVFEIVKPGENEIYASQRFEWCGPGIAAQIDNPELQDFPLVAEGFTRWVQMLSAGRRLAGIVANFPEVERVPLQAQGIRSILIVPIMVGGGWWGFIGFDDCATEREWQVSGIDALEAAARILGSAMRRQQIQDSLRQSEARNQAILDALPDLMFRLNREGQVLDFKASARQDLIRSDGQIVGTTVRELLPPAVASLALEKIGTTLATGNLQTFEYEVPMPQGVQTFEARLVVSSALDNAGHGNEVLAILRNVSERAMLEQMKSDFINRAAHELRTPLTTVIMMADLIQEGGTPEELETYWQVMQRELKRQRLLVEKLLTAGRLENGSFQTPTAPIELDGILREALTAVTPQAEARAIDVQFYSPAEPIIVNADSASLSQVFVNLLSNAIKFTPSSGQVSLTAKADKESVTLIVSDNGVGIPPSDLPYIFTRFFRAQNAIETEVPGSGMGLYIVKGIVETMGGRVQVTSELGRGTTFRVWLPRVPNPANYE